ncbi:MAG: hypothetical protein CSA18_04310 [Deltaproteobacteria bacterium]|nr:MAG: hypothetical protein CSA18_04310 [Deltaproteobacteria bacterium]
MKRFILSLAVAATIFSIPMAASALEKMNNAQLKSATGQAGVSIAVDDIVIYKKGLADVTYIDTNGLGAATQAGIMIDYADATEKLTIIDAITESSSGSTYAADTLQTTFNIDPSLGAVGIVAGAETYDGTNPWATVMDPTNGNVSDAVAEFATGISPLTIDVGECESLSDGWDSNTGAANPGDNGFIAGVVIGLPTVEITNYYTTDTKAIRLVESTAVNNDPQYSEFITIRKSGNSTMAILGGRLEIAPH